MMQGLLNSRERFLRVGSSRRGLEGISKQATISGDPCCEEERERERERDGGGGGGRIAKSILSSLYSV